LKLYIFEVKKLTFDTVIIDDANLVKEIDALSALKHGCKRLIMVGNLDLPLSLFHLSGTKEPLLFERLA